MPEIHDYFFIGDLHSGALVSKNASIDWMCLPHFDSPSIFSKMVDKDGGSFTTLADGYDISSSYVPHTAIVSHVFKKEETAFELRDFMVPQAKDKCGEHLLVRKWKATKGSHHIHLEFSPKAGYGKEYFISNENLQNETHANPQRKSGDVGILLQTDKETIILYVPSHATIEQHEHSFYISFELKEHTTEQIMLSYQERGSNVVHDSQSVEEDTVNFWHEWVGKGTFFDFRKEMLVRSAITLKLMQYYPTGALIAAPTTSLPEEIGGVRNWDYRYTWIRDATFTLYAFHILGYKEEAEKFFTFIHTILEKHEKDEFDVSLMYTIDGKPVPEEKTLDHLSGYKNSRPVRIGNNAANQFQLDVYGALIDAHYFALKHLKKEENIYKHLVMKLVRKIEQRWQEKDSGIWEVRGSKQHFTYSKVMAWVGADRAKKIAKQLNFPSKDLEVCNRLSDEIYDWIWRNSFDDKHTKLLQYPNSPLQDGTNFLFVLLQFLDKHDTKTKKILQNTCKELCKNDIFVYRYLGEDGLEGEEGAFLLCTFWMISAYAVIEDTEKAEDLLNSLEKYCSKIGLFSEEIDPKTKTFLGNYPQAFSHQGYIMSAYYIHRYKQKETTK